MKFHLWGGDAARWHSKGGAAVSVGGPSSFEHSRQGEPKGDTVLFGSPPQPGEAPCMPVSSVAADTLTV